MSVTITKLMSAQQDLSGFEQLFMALSDSTRLRLLALMTGGPVSVGYLADQINESQPKTSRHLAYLRNAGLVSTSREGKWVYYQMERQSDPGVQNVLSTALDMIAGVSTAPEGTRGDLSTRSEYSLSMMEAHISSEAYMSEWTPNELEIHLL